MSVRRIPPLPPEILKKAAFADIPGRLPRGYFDELLAPTKTLLNRGLKMAQAADWFIQNGILKPQRRRNFIDSMHVRFTRFRREKVEAGQKLEWRSALGLDACHMVSGVKALCGAAALRWMAAGEGQRQCTRCKGILSAQTLNIHR